MNREIQLPLDLPFTEDELPLRGRRKCANPQCDAPVTDSDQEYCSEECQHEAFIHVIRANM